MFQTNFGGRGEQYRLAANETAAPTVGRPCPTETYSRFQLRRIIDGMRRTSLLFFFVASAVLAFIVTSAVVGGAQNADAGQQPPGPPRYDPAYERLAHGSGGQVIYMDRSEAAKATEILEAKQNRESIAAAYEQTSPGSLEIPVDSFTATLYITLSGSEAGSDFKIVRPAGQPFEDGHGGRVTRMARTVVVAVDHPEPGLWRAEFTPRGVASIAATAKSDLFVATFEFDELRGRPGHEGYMKIEGAPRANQTLHAEFTCSDNTIRTAQVALLGNDLRELASANFHRIGPNAADPYAGKLRVPDRPFRVIVRGTDVNNAPYQRVYAPLFVPEAQ